MIVYMIMDTSTGKWYAFNHWFDRQEQGTMWTYEDDADTILGSIPEPHSVVKLKFVLSPVIEDEQLNSTVVTVEGQMWVFCPESDSWLCGTRENGCGVFNEEDGWDARVIVGDDIHCLNQRESMKQAMTEALDCWRRITK